MKIETKILNLIQKYESNKKTINYIKSKVYSFPASNISNKNFSILFISLYLAHKMSLNLNCYKKLILYSNINCDDKCNKSLSKNENCIKDSFYIYYYVNKEDEIYDLQSKIYSPEGRKLGLYSCFVRREEITENHQEITCYHYTDKKKLPNILNKGLLPLKEILSKKNLRPTEDWKRIGYVYCTVNKNHFHIEKSNNISRWRKRFGNVRLKIKCYLDDVEYWDCGFIPRSFEILFKKISPEKIIGYKTYK